MMKNVFNMFGAIESIPVQNVEILVMGIENIYDNSEYRIDLGNGKILEVSDSLRFR